MVRATARPATARPAMPSARPAPAGEGATITGVSLRLKLTIACAANDVAQARATLDKIAEFIENFHLPVQLTEAESDLLSF